MNAFKVISAVPASIIPVAVLCLPKGKKHHVSHFFYILGYRKHRFYLLKISKCKRAPKDCCDIKSGSKYKCDIVDSIAMEASLSHILNAKGEKLQKAVACARSIEELLAIDRSVNKTIMNITELEHTLFRKLKSIVCGPYNKTNP